MTFQGRIVGLASLGLADPINFQSWVLKPINFLVNSKEIQHLNPISPRLFSNLFPLGGGRHISHPVELDTKFFLHQNFSLRGLRVSIADFGFEGPGFDSQ